MRIIDLRSDTVTRPSAAMLKAMVSAELDDDVHFARTRLLALENTTGGKVVPQAWVLEATGLAKARGLVGLPGLEVQAPQTNIVWVSVAAPLSQTLTERLKAAGVLASGTSTVRFVTHLDVSRQDIDTAVEAVARAVSGR